MKISFNLPTDNKRHRYCQNCFSEDIHDVFDNEKRLYKCNKCGNVYDRLIDIDPQLVYWVDPITKEYWHESVGIFVLRNDKKILFIERTIYPWGYTVASGHLEIGEKPIATAIRELKEETGIITDYLIDFKTIDIDHDPCRRGADCHRWHAFVYKLKNEQEITTDPEEGKDSIWLTLKEGLAKKLTPPVKYILEKYGEEIINS